MWVQMHNILLGMMNQVYSENFGKTIGKVMDIDVDKDGMGRGP